MTTNEQIRKESFARFSAICAELRIDRIKAMDHPMVPDIIGDWMFRRGTENEMKRRLENLAILCPTIKAEG